MSGPTGIVTLWEESIQVKSYEVDFAGQLRLASMFNYFQETAGNHATHLGVGYEKLRTLGYYWVLSKAKVMIQRLPQWRETLTLATWPKGQDGLLFLRDFRMTDGDGEILLTGSTGWLLIDAEHNKPQLAEVLKIAIPPNKHGSAIEGPLKKLRPPEEPRPVYERKVLASDLDVNNHVNNARYLEWIADGFDQRHAASGAVAAFQVNYVGEAVLGNTITMRRADATSGNSTYIEGVNQATGSKVMQAIVEWR